MDATLFWQVLYLPNFPILTLPLLAGPLGRSEKGNPSHDGFDGLSQLTVPAPTHRKGMPNLCDGVLT